uniref:PDZ domain-containing protein n=1 Tax=Angiostrongylus cantonensis TaxID=6313 RepID=A0A0K0CTH3_ANGCA
LISVAYGCRQWLLSGRHVKKSREFSRILKAISAIAAHNLKFCCQLAHGSPTAIISNFTSIDELFQSIADCFNISADDIIFCTVNTFKIDMDKLFAGSLGYADMLFAHIKGQAIEVELTKTEGMFGITVSDNGRCRSFIKRLKENSIVCGFPRARPALAVGQLIECIDGVNVTGMRHFEVVRILRNMPIGKTFILRVVSPKQSASRKKNVNDGMQTLRFKATGGVRIFQGVVDKEMIGRLNEILDSYLGVQDDQMAQSLWELALSCKTLPDMSKAVKESELSVFDFPEELVFDMWGVVGDSRRTRDNQAKPKPKEKQNLLRRDEKLAPTPLFY